MSRFAQLGNDLYTGKRSYNIVGNRRLWYTVSAVLIAVSLIGLFGRGLNFGIEFRGGSEFRVSTVTDLSDYEARAGAALEEADAAEGTTTATLVGTDTVRVQTGELDNDTSEAVRGALAESFGVPVAEVTSSFVGPSWGETVTTKAIQALIVFLLLVSLVLAVYFRTWKMAAAALIALLHDLLFTVGIYALLGIEVSPASMIGFLTILGYSIYDTIVVFDKVRENTEEAFDTRRMSYAQAANLAVNQTLVRSINTSVVALLPVTAILVVGVAFIGPGTLLDLAVALFIGIAVGTFSSIFIATPILVHLRQNEDEVKALEKSVGRRATRQAEAAEAAAPAGDSPEEGDVPAGTPTRTTPAGEPGGRQVHPYAQRGPRNQPRRPPKSRR